MIADEFKDMKKPVLEISLIIRRKKLIISVNHLQIIIA